MLSSQREDAGLIFSAHVGISMNPTLSELDLLEIAPYANQPIRVGDVIFFLHPDGDQPVVHRVASMTPVGIRTQGDNTSRVDPWIIQSVDVIGRVIRATRGKTSRFIYGGTAGRLWACGLRGIKVLEQCLSFFYHRLARWGLLRRLVPLRKRMRIIAIKRPGGTAFQLLLENWLIGRYEPGTPNWYIRRPFRLFVDVASLPQ